MMRYAAILLLAFPTYAHAQQQQQPDPVLMTVQVELGAQAVAQRHAGASINALMGAYEKLAAENAALKGQIAELKKKDAAPEAPPLEKRRVPPTEPKKDDPEK